MTPINQKKKIILILLNDINPLAYDFSVENPFYKYLVIFQFNRKFMKVEKNLNKCNRMSWNNYSYKMRFLNRRATLVKPHSGHF